MLSVIAASRWAENLVLRGIVPLRAWLGQRKASSTENFRDEYPTVRGDASAWQERLALALARSFDE
jgi:hypothetical protein